MIRCLFSKPKVIFGDSHMQGATEEGQKISCYIPVRNLRRYGWLGWLFKRNDAIECRIKIEFIMDNKLLYKFVEPWADLPVGKTIPADSSYNDFLIASIGWDGHISLSGKLGTNASLERYRIPKKAHIIANIKVTSREKVIAKCKWAINIRYKSIDPLQVIRIEV